MTEAEDMRATLLAGEDFEIERSNEYASLIIHSMETGQPRIIYGNVRNDKLIDNLWKAAASKCLAWWIAMVCSPHVSVRCRPNWRE